MGRLIFKFIFDIAFNIRSSICQTLEPNIWCWERCISLSLNLISDVENVVYHSNLIYLFVFIANIQRFQTITIWLSHFIPFIPIDTTFYFFADSNLSSYFLMYLYSSISPFSFRLCSFLQILFLNLLTFWAIKHVPFLWCLMAF